MSERKDWIYLPHAGHLIVGRDCRFHLATVVGNYLVSTVGEYEPDAPIREILAESRGITLKGKGDARKKDWLDRCGYEEIGLGRTYETMVFKAAKDSRNACCGWTAADWSEVDMRGYKNADEARYGHEQLCTKWAQRE